MKAERIRIGMHGMCIGPYPQAVQTYTFLIMHGHMAVETLHKTQHLVLDKRVKLQNKSI